MQKHHGVTLANIFLENYFTNATPRSGEKPAAKLD